jgi:hypothetical protein
MQPEHPNSVHFGPDSGRHCSLKTRRKIESEALFLYCPEWQDGVWDISKTSLCLTLRRVFFVFIGRPKKDGLELNLVNSSNKFNANDCHLPY